jgi:hypothetical protein
MPHVGNQDCASTSRDFLVDLIDEFCSNSTSTLRTLYNEFTQVSPETEVMSANKPQYLTSFLPNESETAGRDKYPFENIMTPAILPKSGFGLH